MTHPRLCELSKSKTKCCKCRCKGALHNIRSTEGKGEGINWRVLKEDFGGEVENFIKQAKGLCFSCVCGNPIVVNQVCGYTHDGGLLDKDGKKWWVFVNCGKCNYDWSWQKILKKKEMLSLNKTIERRS